MTAHRDNLEPIEPRIAQELFLDHKEANHAQATVRNYKYRLNHFVRWCDESNIQNLNDLTGRDIQKYRLWRKEDGDLNKLTLRAQMSTLRVFLKWAGSIEAVPENLYNKVLVPRVRPEERQRDEILDRKEAQEILEYLSKYHYASIEHLLLALLWESGMRIGSVRALDLNDVNIEEKFLSLVHRPDKGTSLKNGKGGERMIAFTPALAQILKDFIDQRRHDVTDEHGRAPLLTTSNGRIHRNTIRRTIYRITTPCFRGDPCEKCARCSEEKCTEAVSPHAIRRGSITHYLSNDVPVEVVSDRMNVSRKVLDEHYDKRSERVKLEQRRGYLENI